jgi:hypothetical protein
MRAFPLLALLLLGACALEPSARPQAEPRFEPEQWFLGRTFGTGEFRPLLGKPSEFRMVVEGRREGQALIMEETFTTAKAVRGGGPGQSRIPPNPRTGRRRLTTFS